MIKFYKFNMHIQFEDVLENEDPYYPSGIVSALNFDQFLFEDKVTIAWKSPKGIAYESSIELKDIDIEPCSKAEYLELTQDIDYINNNNLSRLFEDTFKIEESKPVGFKIIK